MTAGPLTAAPDPATSNTWHGHMSNGVGTTFGPDPLAVLTVSAESLQVAGKLGEFTIPRRLVRKISRGRLYPWIFGGIRIHHESPGVPEEIQFKPMGIKTAQLLAGLRQLGLPVP